MTDIPRLNIDELYERKKETDSQRVSIYNKLLSKVHTKIKLSSRMNMENEFCYYVMPEILIGYPNYNFQECVIYITSCLQDDGFLTKYVHPNLILISWRHWIPQYVCEEIKKKTNCVIYFSEWSHKIKKKAEQEASRIALNIINKKLSH